MSHNVGAIHVRASRESTHEQVAEAIEAYFVGRGARRSDRGAKQREPLSVEDTHKLAVLVLPAKQGWITVMDSEAYTASRGLAAHLGAVLRADVLHWEVNGATETASLERFTSSGRASIDDLQGRTGPVGAEPEPGERGTPGGVEEVLEAIGVPYAMMRFQDMAAKRGPEGAVWMGFADVSDEAYWGDELDGDEGDAEGDEDSEKSVDSEADRASSDETSRYLDLAERLFHELVATPHVAPSRREWLFSVRASSFAPTVLAYPRSGLDALWETLVQPRWVGGGSGAPQFERAVKLLRLHLGWSEGTPATATSDALARDWLCLATALVGLRHADAREAVRGALATSLSADTLDEAAHLLDALDERAAAKRARELARREGSSKKLSAERKAELAAFVAAWAPLAEPSRACRSVLVARAELARALGDSAERARMQQGVRARDAAMAAVIAAEDDASLAAALDESTAPLETEECDALATRGEALLDRAPAMAARLASVLADGSPTRAARLAARAAERGVALDDMRPLCELIAEREPALSIALARVALAGADADRAATQLRRAKERGARELADVVTDASLRPLLAREDVARLFDEPVRSAVEGGPATLREVHAMVFTWANPLRVAGAHMAPVFEAFVQRYGDRLRYGNTSANKSGVSALNDAMLARARGSFVSKASAKGFVAGELRDANDGASGYAIGWLGSQDKDERSVLWMTVPVGAFGDGDALFEAFVACAERAGPYDSGYADVAMAFEMGGVNAYDPEHYAALALHVGLDLLPSDLALRLHQQRTGVVGARFAVALSSKLAKGLSIPPALGPRAAGQGVAMRAGSEPSRGSLLRPSEPWMDQRRALAKALEPVTDFELTPYDWDAWSRRWLTR